MGSFNKLTAAVMLLLAPSLAAAGQPRGPRSDAADRTVVAHASRVLSLGEICNSIQRALRSNGAPENALPSAGQIRLTLPITVSVDDPGLQVLRMDPDVVPGSVRVRLWTGKEPAIHPFDVRVLTAGDLLQWLDKPEASAHASVAFAAAVKPVGEKHLAQPPAPKPPTLVFPGRTATLFLEASDMEVRTPAMPLARGTSGEWILVRNLSTGQILNAQVVGPGSLATQF